MEIRSKRIDDNERERGMGTCAQIVVVRPCWWGLERQRTPTPWLQSRRTAATSRRWAVCCVYNLSTGGLKVSSVQIVKEPTGASSAGHGLQLPGRDRRRRDLPLPSRTSHPRRRGLQDRRLAKSSAARAVLEIRDSANTTLNGQDLALGLRKKRE